MNKTPFKTYSRIPPKALAIAALAVTANETHAVGYTFSDLGTVSGAYAGMTVSGINNLGQVVGGDGIIPYVWNGDTATALDVPPGADTTSGIAINDAGQVAGYNYAVGADRGYPIRWTGGAPSVVDTLGGGFISAALTINNSGQMGGSSWFGSSFRPVRWDGITITELDTLGGTAGSVGGINDAGIVVGESRITNDDGKHATLWTGTSATDLGTLGGTNSTAIDVNNTGQIVGWGGVRGDATTHAIFWNGLNASPQDLGTLGGDYSAAQAINESGQIVGQSEFEVGNTLTHATVWNGTAPGIDLNVYLPADLAAAGWVLAYGFGINNDGVIVGTLANTADPNLTGAFKLTPAAVPVPAPIWLLGSALAGCGLLGRRKLP